jgi:hypothetical protein
MLTLGAEVDEADDVNDVNELAVSVKVVIILFDNVPPPEPPP